MRIILLSLLLIIPSIFLVSPNPSASTPALSLSDIKRVYSEIKDIKGDFIQKTYIKDLKKTETYKGSFAAKIPSKMKWRYAGLDNETEIIIKGKEMIIFQKKTKQALRQRFDPNLYGQIPVALLGGLGSIDNDFIIEERDKDLILKPKRPMGGVVSILLTPSGGEFPIDSLIITDKRSNRIEIRLSDVSINTGVTDALFEFRPPDGVRLQELQ